MLVPDGQQNSDFAPWLRASWRRVRLLSLKEAAAGSGVIGSGSLLVLGYDGKVGKRRPGPNTAKVKVALGDRIWWIVDVKTEQFEYLFVSGLPDDSEIHEQEETA